MKTVWKFALPKLEWHTDGVTLHGFFPTPVDLRLSNILPNLLRIEQALGGHSLTAMAAAAGFFTSFARADDCSLIPGSYSSQYFMHEGGDGFLAVKYNNDSYVMPALNNVCNFILSDLQPGVYDPLSCLCAVDSGYQVALSGQNISQDWLSCIETFLQGYCGTSHEDLPLAFKILSMVLPVLGVLSCVAIGYVRSQCESLPRESRLELSSFRREEKHPFEDGAHIYVPLSDELEYSGKSLARQGSRARSSEHSSFRREEKDLLEDLVQVSGPNVEPDEPQHPPQNRRCCEKLISGWRELHKTSLLIGFLSAYGTGVIKGAQFYESLILFGVPGEGIPLWVRLGMLPLIPTINATALHYRENKKMIKGVSLLKAETYYAVARQFRDQPMPLLLTAVAGVTEGMMVTMGLLSLFKDDIASDLAWTLAGSLGAFDTMQFILLDGKAFCERINENFFYTSPKYEEHLHSLSKRSWGLVSVAWAKFRVHFVSTLGALLSAALAFVETRELIAHFIPSGQGQKYRENMGSIAGVLFSADYLGMQYSLYGYRAQEAMAYRLSTGEWMEPKIEPEPSLGKIIWRKILKILAIGGGVVEGLTIFAASVGFYKIWWEEKVPGWEVLGPLLFLTGVVGSCQNYWVEGYELMEVEPLEHETEDSDEKASDSASGPLLPLGAPSYRAFLDFFSGLIRVALFTASRAGTRFLVSSAATADEISDGVTASSYVESSVTMAMVWGLFELFRWKSPSYRALSLNSATFDEKNEYELQRHADEEFDQNFRRNWWRVAAQFLSQLILPVVGGIGCEKYFRNLFTDSHLDHEESLTNALITGAFFVSLFTVGISYGIDKCFRRWSESFLEQLRKQDKNLFRMAMGLIGYDPRTFCKLIHVLEQKTAPSSKIKIGGVLELREGKEELEIVFIDSKEEYDDEKASERIGGVLELGEQKEKPGSVFTDSKEEKEEYDEKASDLSISKDKDKLKDRLPILNREKNRLLKKIEEGEQHSRLDSGLDQMFKEIGKVENGLVEINNTPSDSKEQKGNRWATKGKALREGLTELKKNDVRLFPYFLDKITGAMLHEDYGFLYVARDEKNTFKIVGHHPSNNPLAIFILNSVISRYQSELELNCQWMEARDRLSFMDSGPWVIMQIEALLKNGTDLSSQPRKVVQNTNLSEVRLSQFSWIATSVSSVQRDQNEQQSSREHKLQIN